MRESFCRIITLCVMCFALGGCIYYSALSYSQYAQGQSNLVAVQSTSHIEVLHITASDGTPLKAIYYIKPNLMTYTNRSVPVVIYCHGMSSRLSG